MSKLIVFMLTIVVTVFSGTLIEAYLDEIIEFIFESIALVLPSKLNEKYTNSNIYSNVLSKHNTILKSKKINDKIKSKLLSKKLIKLLNKSTIVNIISNINCDELKYHILSNKNIFKEKLNKEAKLDFKDNIYYEKIFSFLDEKSKIYFLSYVNNDNFVIDKVLNGNLNISTYNLTNIILSLNEDKSKLVLLPKIDKAYSVYRYDIISSFKDKRLILHYIDEFDNFYLKQVFSFFSPKELENYMNNSKYKLLILQILDDVNIVEKYFDNFSDKEKISFIKNVNNNKVKYYLFKKITNILNDKEKLEILLSILKNEKDLEFCKEIVSQINDDTYKLMLLSNSKNFKKDILINEPKIYPINADQNITFGVELETSHEYSKIYLTLKNMLSNWKITRDSSIYEGIEIVSPILRYNSKSLQELKYVCDFLENNNFFVNNECGGHIHIGFDYFKNPKEVEMLYTIYTNCQDIFLDICNRKNSTIRPKIKCYAKPISQRLYIALRENNFNDIKNIKNFVEKMKTIQNSRYFDINIYNALNKNKNTIEFRFPNGEINYDEVLLNITLIIKLVMVSKKYAYINEFDERYIPIKLLEDISIDIETRKNILLKLLFEDNEELINLYNERFESNKKETSYERVYALKF
ncbi:MAG: amidoligase family protein [bacterium]|nr:amidoligase family protein [bacterium]